MVEAIAVVQHTSLATRMFGFKSQLVYFLTYYLQSKSEFLPPGNEASVNNIKPQTCTLFF